MNTYRTTPSALTLVAYLVALAVPVILGLSVVGSSPYLLARVVPEEHQDTVAGFGVDVPGLSDWGADAAAGIGTAGPGRYAIPGAGPAYRGEWSPRRPDDYPPPAGLVAGIDYSVHTTDDGFIAHWPCGEEIPVWTFNAPPGNTADLIWAVDTLAWTSGLPLRHAGPGTEAERESTGAISVTFGDHPEFHVREVAGVGGPTELWPDGRISRGSVTLRADRLDPRGHDPGTRAVILHELIHAVGVTHAADDRPEIMAPQVAPRPQTILGYGDRFALEMVGCH